MRVFVVVTSYNEPDTVGKAVEQIICPNKVLWPSLQLYVTAPDEATLKSAEKVCQSNGFSNYHLIKDAGQGKASALNLTVETITSEYVINPVEDVLVLTDGDVYLDNSALQKVLDMFSTSLERYSSSKAEGRVEKLGGVGGHPVSLDDRHTMFGYYSHLFCGAAHCRRVLDFARTRIQKARTRTSQPIFLRARSVSDESRSLKLVPMSGYLYAVRFDPRIFPIPAAARAEDAYISEKIAILGYSIAYEPNALVFVKFPKNLHDWLKQKTRSLGGNVQITRLSKQVLDSSFHSSLEQYSSSEVEKNGATGTRSIMQDVAMAVFPLTFAKSPKELVWSLLLYPLRLFLWVKIYYIHLFNKYRAGAWERVESSK